MKKYISFLLILFLVSCDLFTTRTPELPDTAAQTNIAATNPDSLFKNFQTSIEKGILQNYISCFVDTSFLKRKFKFIPSSGSVTQYPILNGWNFDAEKQYFQNEIIKTLSGTTVT